jgi:hypothetical protein
MVQPFPQTPNPLGEESRKLHRLPPLCLRGHDLPRRRGFGIGSKQESVAPPNQPANKPNKSLVMDNDAELADTVCVIIRNGEVEHIRFFFQHNLGAFFHNNVVAIFVEQNIARANIHCT